MCDGGILWGSRRLLEPNRIERAESPPPKTKTFGDGAQQKYFPSPANGFAEGCTHKRKNTESNEIPSRHQEL